VAFVYFQVVFVLDVVLIAMAFFARLGAGLFIVALAAEALLPFFGKLPFLMKLGKTSYGKTATELIELFKVLLVVATVFVTIFLGRYLFFDTSGGLEDVWGTLSFYGVVLVLASINAVAADAYEKDQKPQ